MRVGRPVPTESAEQQNLMAWANACSGAHPELKLLHHIPNGGKRTKSGAGKLKAEGVKAGVPDICLPVARRGYHGLYIELKRIKDGCTSIEQEQWLKDLAGQGYRAELCNGWVHAAHWIAWYLDFDI